MIINRNKQKQCPYYGLISPTLAMTYVWVLPFGRTKIVYLIEQQIEFGKSKKTQI